MDDCFDEISGAPKEIRIDFAMRREILGDIEKRSVIPSYSDLQNQPETISVMSLNTILANKIGLLMDMTRNEPRDVFDIWFLLKRTSDFNFNFEQVCQLFRNRYSFYPSFSTVKSALHNRSVARNWEMRLSKQLAEVADYKTVISEIERELERLFQV